MKLLIDTADIQAIERLWKVYPLTGVTTNPTILKKSGQPPFKVLHGIRARRPSFTPRPCPPARKSCWRKPGAL